MPALIYRPPEPALQVQQTRALVLAKHLLVSQLAPRLIRQHLFYLFSSSEYFPHGEALLLSSLMRRPRRARTALPPSSPGLQMAVNDGRHERRRRIPKADRCEGGATSETKLRRAESQRVSQPQHNGKRTKILDADP